MIRSFKIIGHYRVKNRNELRVSKCNEKLSLLYYLSDMITLVPTFGPEL